MNNENIIVEYHNIDNFNRPVFKRIDKKEFYGSCDILFPSCESEIEVLKKVNADNLVYFGNKFNCEPMGTPVKNITIKRGNIVQIETKLPKSIHPIEFAKDAKEFIKSMKEGSLFCVVYNLKNNRLEFCYYMHTKNNTILNFKRFIDSAAKITNHISDCDIKYRKTRKGCSIDNLYSMQVIVLYCLKDLGLLKDGELDKLLSIQVQDIG